MSPIDASVPPRPWVQSLRALLTERLGHVVPEDRLVRDVAPCITAHTEEAGLTDPADLIEELRGGHRTAAWDDLVRAVTIGETYFARHPVQLDAIVSHCRQLRAGVDRTLHIWSAGCATGEEPYTLAMLLSEYDVPCEIVASDVNPVSLAKARSATGYSDRSVGHLPERLRKKWMQQETPGRWRLVTPGALGVHFVEHNLAVDPPLRPTAQADAWDVILCRNVLIYFRTAAGTAVIEALAHVLAEEGRLWIAPCDLVRTGAAVLTWGHERGERYLRHGRSGRQPLPTKRAQAPESASSGVKTPSGSDHIRDLVEWGLVATVEDVVEHRLEDQPDDGTALLLQGALKLRAHAFEEALTSLDRATKAHPKPEGSEYFRATALLEVGRHPEALEAFRRAVDDDPDDWASSYQVAALLRRSGRILLEEAMLERTAALLSVDAPRVPSFGSAALLVNSVHGDPFSIRRAVEERLLELRRGRSTTPVTPSTEGEA